jgi:enoyl-CoA hydratase/carnithine racemase
MNIDEPGTNLYRTLRVAESDMGVLSVVIDAPPMNLIGPELVRDMVRLLGEVESGQDVRVMVLESADPEYFVPHVDLTKVAEYTAEAAKAGGPGDASLGMVWHKLSELPVVSIAKLRGRARGAGSELALACDMRFAARENAILGQIEVGVGTTPGAGGVQHLARLLGRGRAMEAILADAGRFRQLVTSDTAKGRTTALFTQGLQTRGPLELDLGDRVGAL